MKQEEAINWSTTQAELGSRIAALYLLTDLLVGWLTDELIDLLCWRISLGHHSC